MGRRSLLAAGAILLSALVLGFGLYAGLETESRLLGAAEAEGRALLQAVAAGIESNIEASRAVERLLEERLDGLAVVLEHRLADRPGREREELRQFAMEHGLRGALLLDDDLGVRAAAGPERPDPPRAGGPLTVGRLDRYESEAIARRAREAGLAEADRVVLGFGGNPLRPRTEFLVGVRARSLGGYLLLRLDGQPVETFRRQAGIDRMVREAARAEAIDYLIILGEDGVVLAADDPARKGVRMSLPEGSTWRTTAAGARVLDVALPAPWDGPPAGSLHVGLAAGPVDAVRRRARIGLGVTTLLVLVTGNGALVFLAVALGRLRRRESTLRREFEARERFAALGRLASGVAHEIRSPLNALSMAAQRLAREAAPEEGEKRDRFLDLTGALRTSVGRLDATVEEFLTLGRPAPPPERSPVDLARLAEEVAAAECPDATLEPPTSPLTILADESLLGKAMANLVRNARQAAPAGTVAIAWRRGPGKGTITVEVRDGGPGIPPGERDRIFEPFRTGRSGGTGLGLAIARDAVEAQGGRILVGDAPGGGARFEIRISEGGHA